METQLHPYLHTFQVRCRREVKTLHLAIIIGVTFLVMANAHPAFSQATIDNTKMKCPAHISTRLHDPSYIQRAVKNARESPDFAEAARNENLTFHDVYGEGQYDYIHCNNFFWQDTVVVFSGGNTSGTTHYVLAIEPAELPGGATGADSYGTQSARFNDSFVGSRVNDELFRNNHGQGIFIGQYPPQLDATPLRQTESGVFPENVECRDGFVLMTKGMHAYCIRPDAVQRLEPNGWSPVKTYDVTRDFAWCKDYASGISDGRVLLTCKGQSGGVFGLPSPTYVMTHCPGIYGCTGPYWYKQQVPSGLLSEKQRETVENMTLAVSGIGNGSRWSLDRFLVFTSGNQWFSDVQLFVNNGTAGCGRYVQSEINLENLEVLSSFTTDPGFSVCRTEVPQTNNVTNTGSSNPLGITALVVYHPFLGCLSAGCAPNNFYLKINSNSSAYLLGYDICDGKSCTSNGTVSVQLPINSPLKPEYARVWLPQGLMWQDGDAVSLKLMVSSLPDNRTATLLDLGNSTIVP